MKEDQTCGEFINAQNLCTEFIYYFFYQNTPFAIRVFVETAALTDATSEKSPSHPDVRRSSNKVL